MNAQSPISAADKDKAAYTARNETKLNDLLAYAAKQSGRSVIQIAREFPQMNKSDARINIGEYVRWRLYDTDRYTAEERDAFISNDLHWPMVHICCDSGWRSAAEDKVLAGTILTSGGVPVPEAVAVIDRTARLYPGLQTIASGAELRALLTGPVGPNLFGKIVDGMISFGAFRVETADDTHITCSGHAPMTYDAFMAEFVGENAYLLQKRSLRHPRCL